MRRIFILYLASIILCTHALSAIDVAMYDQGTGVKNSTSGDLLSSGSLNVLIYDAASDGNLVYNETFTSRIVNGSWNVLLGENPAKPLALEFNKAYYKDYRINDEDASFTNSTGHSVARQKFFSPLGEIGSSDLAAGLNITDNLAIGGSFGVGTLQPTQNMHISASDDVVLRLQATGAGGSAWDIWTSTTPQNYLGFTNSISDATHMVITENGNVGINVTDPTFMFQVGQTGGGNTHFGAIRSSATDIYGFTSQAYGSATNIYAASVYTNPTAATDAYGLQSVVGAGASTNKYGVFSRVYAQDSNTSYGIYSRVLGSVDSGGYSYGVFSKMENIGADTTSIGGYFTAVNMDGTAYALITGNGNVGIGTSTPARSLHINATMRLEPISAAPDDAGEGDIYFNSVLHKPCYYNSTTWLTFDGAACS